MTCLRASRSVRSLYRLGAGDVCVVGGRNLGENDLPLVDRGRKWCGYIFVKGGQSWTRVERREIDFQDVVKDIDVASRMNRQWFI